MAKVKVSELSGGALDWLVANCEGLEEETLDILTWECTAYPSGCYNFSSDWSQGGPIIERECINVWAKAISSSPVYWEAQLGNCIKGRTPLEAAMRCYVASKLGDEVEIPDELLERTGE